MALVWDARQRRDTGGTSAFVVHERIATGGMAEVFLATRRGLEGFAKPVVLKRILPEYAEDDRFCEMFAREARLGAHLSHPNIVQVLDLGRDGGSLYIALEYVPGPDLARWIRVRRNRGVGFDTRLACHIVHEIVAALEHAHSATDVHGNALQIVHRDVSPHNVLISTDGAIKLGDFGIARAHADDGGRTQAGTIKGKLSYMAPEQARGDPVDARTDLYSAAIILYELLTLQRPYGMNVDPNMILRLHAGQHTPIEQLRPDLPATLRRVLDRGLSPRAEDRFDSAAHMRADLAAFLGGRSHMGRAEVAKELARDLPDEVGRAKKFVHRALSPIAGGHTETIELQPAQEVTVPERGALSQAGGTLLGAGPPSVPPALEDQSASGVQLVFPASSVMALPSATAITRSETGATPGRSRGPWALALVFVGLLFGGVVVGFTFFGRPGGTPAPSPIETPVPEARPGVPHSTRRGVEATAAEAPPARPPEIETAPTARAPEVAPAATAATAGAPAATAGTPVVDGPGEPQAPTARVPEEVAPVPDPSAREVRSAGHVPARPVAASRAPARLTIRAPNGWSKVWVNGQGPLMAPLRERTVPSGRLSVRFESPRGEQRVSRQARPGESIVLTAP